MRRSKIRDEPVPEGQDWVEWGGELIWAMGFTSGGAPYGLTLDQFTTFVIGRRAFVLAFTLIGTLLAFAWIRQSPAHLFRAVMDASRKPSEGASQLGASASVEAEPGGPEPGD